MTELTHFDESGASRMVDVTEKDVTLRTARASGCVRLEPSTLALVVDRPDGQGGRSGSGSSGWNHGGQAHRRVDPALSSAGAR